MAEPVIPPPPPGFVLDSNIPPPPPGFVLDQSGGQQAAAPLPQPQPTWTERAMSYLPSMHTASLAIGGMVGGLAGPAGVPVGVAGGEGLYQIGQHLMGDPNAPQTTSEAAYRTLEPAALTAGMEMGMQGVGAIANKGGRWLAERGDASRLWNKAAGVPAGRKGVSVSMKTGQPTTNPGQAMVRQVEKEGYGPIGQKYQAMKARPNKVMQARSFKELNETGKAVRGHLTGSDVDVKLELPDTPKARAAAKAANLNVPEEGPMSITTKPINAHLLQSELGDRINWNPNVVNDHNELMKDAFFQLKDQMEKSVPGFKAVSKPWQEAYLFNKALRHQMELQAAGRAMPPSALQSGLMRGTKTFGRRAIIGGGLVGGARVLGLLGGE